MLCCFLSHSKIGSKLICKKIKFSLHYFIIFYLKNLNQIPFTIQTDLQWLHPRDYFQCTINPTEIIKLASSSVIVDVINRGGCTPYMTLIRFIVQSVRSQGSDVHAGSEENSLTDIIHSRLNGIYTFTIHRAQMTAIELKTQQSTLVLLRFSNGDYEVLQTQSDKELSFMKYVIALSICIRQSNKIN